MKELTLYIDNFRGFQKTIIEINKINFLVGENSTGKSSILGLVDLLKSQEFFTNFKFNNNNSSFGYFDDIVSINSKDKSHFTIGIEFKIGEKQCAISLVFINYNNQPTLKYMTINSNNNILIIKKQKTNTKISFKEIIKPVSIIDIDTYYKYFNIAKLDEYKGFKNAGTSDTNFLPLYYIGYIIRDTKIDKHILALMTRHKKIWIAPIRSKPKISYHNYNYDYASDGGHVPYLLKENYLKSTFRNSKKILEKLGKDSGLFDEIKIKKFSKMVTSPFSLDIVLDGKEININHVGYGVSQVLPILIESLMFDVYDEKKYFFIQQPEVHLHPKAQASLGTFFFKVYNEISNNSIFFIETHSDYMIDRFRAEVRDAKLENSNSSILFFDRSKEGNTVVNLEIEINGNLPEELPQKYRDFFINESFHNLGF